MLGNLPLQVFVFNVGDGDNILLRLPDGSFGFIDFSYSEVNNPVGEPPSLTYVKFNAPSKPKCSFISLSDYHFDQIKGLNKWIAWARDKEISQIWLPGIRTPIESFSTLINIIEDPQVLKRVLSEYPYLVDRYQIIADLFRKMEIFFEQQKKKDSLFSFLSTSTLPNLLPLPYDVRAYCLSPGVIRVVSHIMPNSGRKNILHLLNERELQSSENYDVSAVLLLQYKRFRLLFGGQASTKNMEESIAYLKKHPEVCNHQNFEADFIKVPHHGSKYSSSTLIWENILPENSEAVLLAISAGNNKKFHRPNHETLDHIHQAANKKNAKIGIYSTNGKGDHSHEGIPVGEMRVKWPDGKKRREAGKKLDNNLAALGLVTPSQLDSSSQTFLGYCFEFDPDNATEPIRVMRVLPESAIIAPK